MPKAFKLQGQGNATYSFVTHASSQSFKMVVAGNVKVGFNRQGAMQHGLAQRVI